MSQAVSDPACLAVVERMWSETARHLTGVDVDTYGAQLLERFRNPRIEHRLAQIAEDAETKVRLRIVPVATLERAAGYAGEACATAIATWILAVRRGTSAPAGGLDAAADASAYITALDPALGRDRDFCSAVERELTRLVSSLASSPHQHRLDAT